MILNEIFVAFQGEGSTLGVESVFVRLHACPVQCAWCDTAYTWNGTERGERITARQLADRVIEVADQSLVENVIVTGGEPAVHPDLAEFVGALVDAELSVEIETSGMLPLPTGLAVDGVRFNVSPKLKSARARMPVDPDVVARWLAHERSALKLVVADAEDFAEALKLVEALDVERSRVWLMPQATTREELGRAQAEVLALARGTGFRVTTRMHVLAHDGERKT